MRSKRGRRDRIYRQVSSELTHPSLSPGLTAAG
jgi:hypothetical protein